MSIADDLLELAKKMVRYTKPDIRDVRARRAISTAYYALFHFLTERGTAKLASHPGIRILAGRAYAHGEMYKTAKSFRSGTAGLPAQLRTPFSGQPFSLPPELVRVASAFADLQDARHVADYDLSQSYSRADAQGFVALADQAFADWNTASTDPVNADVCDLFLAALLLGDRWKR